MERSAANDTSELGISFLQHLDAILDDSSKKETTASSQGASEESHEDAEDSYSDEGPDPGEEGDEDYEPSLEPTRTPQGRYCCVPHCCNRMKGHVFPRDPQLRQQWLLAIGRTDPATKELWKPSRTSTVCARHFLPDDYKDTLMGIKSILKPGVIPTVFPNKKPRTPPSRSQEHDDGAKSSDTHDTQVVRKEEEKDVTSTGIVDGQSSKDYFFCPYCDFNAAGADSIKQHLMTVHKDSPPVPYQLAEFEETKETLYVCDKCKECFDEKSDVIKHISNDHRPIRAKGKPAASTPVKRKIVSLPNSSAPVEKKTEEDALAKKRKVAIKKGVDFTVMSESTPIKCDVCQETFNVYSEYYEHCGEVHNIGLVCHRCYKTFNSDFAYQQHLNTNHSLHICTRCESYRTVNPRIFSSRHWLDVHYRNMHKVSVNLTTGVKMSKYVCAFCSYHKIEHFKTKGELALHFASVHKLSLPAFEKGLVLPRHRLRTDTPRYLKHMATVQCPYCSVKTTDMRMLAIHIDAYHKDNKELVQTEEASHDLPYSCDLCSASYSSEAERDSHINLRHPGCIKCEICSEMFNSFPFYEAHLRSYHGMEPAPNQPDWLEETPGGFRCEGCGQTFHVEQDYDRHMGIAHSQAQKCKKCNIWFIWSRAYHQHWNKHHRDTANKDLDKSSFVPEAEDKTCMLCFIKFDGVIECALHMKEHHPSSTMCIGCKEWFSDSDTYKRHVEVVHKGVIPDLATDTKYRCLTCRTNFLEERFFDQHMETAHPAAFKCKPCNRWISHRMRCPVNHDEEHAETSSSKDDSRSSSVALQKEVPAGMDFKCSGCGAMFSKEEDYINHVKKQHKSSRQCHICDQVSWSMEEHHEHYREYHQTFVRVKLYETDPEVEAVSVDNDLETRQGINEVTLYICGACQVFYSNREECTNHGVLRHNPGIWCVICKMWLSSFGDYNAHVRSIHKGEGSLKLSVIKKCFYCDDLFYGEDALNDHVKNYHSWERCSTCIAYFPNERTLESHKRRHCARQICKLCLGQFENMRLLSIHIRKHHHVSAITKGVGSGRKVLVNGALQPCKQCTKCFIRFDDLNDHIEAIHNCDEEEEECAECTKLSEESSRVEEGADCFPCPFKRCEIKLSHAIGMDHHLRCVHLMNIKEPLFLDVKPDVEALQEGQCLYRCIYCKETRKYFEGFEKHLLLHHWHLPGTQLSETHKKKMNNAKPSDYTCGFCGIKNQGESGLIHHVSTEHKEVFAALEEDTDSDKGVSDTAALQPLRGAAKRKQKQSSKNNLIKESKVFRCEVCDLVFSSPSDGIFHFMDMHDCKRDFIFPGAWLIKEFVILNFSTLRADEDDENGAGDLNEPGKENIGVETGPDGASRVFRWTVSDNNRIPARSKAQETVIEPEMPEESPETKSPEKSPEYPPLKDIEIKQEPAD